MISGVFSPPVTLMYTYSNAIFLTGCKSHHTSQLRFTWQKDLIPAAAPTDGHIARETVNTLSSLNNKVHCVYGVPEVTNTEYEAVNSPHTRSWQWNIHLVSCFLLMSLAVPSIPFMPQSLALPCLVLAGCLAEDSEAPGSSAELC